MSKRMSSKIEYTCKGKGGRYEILGLATGAGLTRGEDRLIYKDASTGRLFLRTEADFTERMERLMDAAPVVERQPVAHSMKSVAEAVDASRCYTVLTSNQCFSLAQSLNNQAIRVAPPELAELQATIARLTAENERLKDETTSQYAKRVAVVEEIERMKGGQGEAVAWLNVATGHVTTSSVVVMDWDDEKEQVQSLYASQPAQVSVVLPERLTAAELEELEVIEVLLHGQGLSNLAGTMAAARQFIDEIVCLDAPTRTFRLPERKPIEALSFNWTTADVENTGWNACLDKVKELNQ